MRTLPVLKRSMLATLVIGGVALALLHPVSAQSAYRLTSDSRLRIEGTSTVDAFTCVSGGVEGSGRLQGGEAAAMAPHEASQVKAEIAVAVVSFDCGKARMNRDLHEALKAEHYPRIEFVLEQVEPILGGEGSAYALQVQGWLYLAGTRRSVSLNMAGRKLPDGRLRAEGELFARMTDFGVTPPTALLGLVRVHDQITVRFDLYAVREAGAQASR